MKRLVLALLLATVCLAEDPPVEKKKTMFDRLVGSWAGTGMLMGDETKPEVQWEWVLGGKFLRLTFKNDSFEGHAYYLPSGKLAASGTWFDNRGVTWPLKAKVEGDALVAEWGDPADEEGRTTYRLVKTDEMEILDEVKSGGKYVEFGKATLKKK